MPIIISIAKIGKGKNEDNNCTINIENQLIFPSSN